MGEIDMKAQVSKVVDNALNHPEESNRSLINALQQEIQGARFLKVTSRPASTDVELTYNDGHKEKIADGTAERMACLDPKVKQVDKVSDYPGIAKSKASMRCENGSKQFLSVEDKFENGVTVSLNGADGMTIESSGAGGTDKLRILVNNNPSNYDGSAIPGKPRYEFKTEVEATRTGADGSHSAKVNMK